MVFWKPPYVAAEHVRGEYVSAGKYGGFLETTIRFWKDRYGCFLETATSPAVYIRGEYVSAGRYDYGGFLEATTRGCGKKRTMQRVEYQIREYKKGHFALREAPDQHTSPEKTKLGKGWHQ